MNRSSRIFESLAVLRWRALHVALNESAELDFGNPQALGSQYLELRRHHDDAVFVRVEHVTGAHPYAINLYCHVALTFVAFFSR